MRDQASALRELKKRLEGRDNINNHLNAKTISPEEYLQSLPRPCKFTAILLASILPPENDFIPLQKWISPFLDMSKRTCVWDQGELFSAETVFHKTEDTNFPGLQNIETINGPILGIPKMPFLTHLPSEIPTLKVRFLRHLETLLGPAEELWITLTTKNFPITQPIIQATDAAFILIPDFNDAILQGYEAVKTLYMSGYSSPIGLIIETKETIEQGQQIFERIFSVGKKFLGLEIQLGGIILTNDTSNIKIIPENLRPTIDRIQIETRDFLYLFAERMLYHFPGDVPIKNE